jgi:hypothetical protein
MTHALLATLVLVTALARVSAAEPITVGKWSPAPVADNDGVGFYDGASWDCATCNLGFQLPGALEYLHDGAHRPVPFGYRQFEGAVLVSRNTAWRKGVLSWHPAVDAFIYDTGEGYIHSSWQGTNMVLFRLVAGVSTRYWLGVEDLPVGGPQDRDFNDSVYQWTATTTTPPPSSPVPEPGTWTLAVAGLVVALRRRALAAIRQRAFDS